MHGPSDLKFWGDHPPRSPPLSLQATGFEPLCHIMDVVLTKGHPVMTSTRKGRDEAQVHERMWTGPGGGGQPYVDVLTENKSPLTSSCLLLMQITTGSQGAVVLYGAIHL